MKVLKQPSHLLCGSRELGLNFPRFAGVGKQVLGTRKRLLEYLKTKDIDEFNRVVSELNIRYKSGTALGRNF